MKTLLEIVQATQAELGLPMSVTVVGNTDATTIQMFYLSNRVLDEIRRENDWSVLNAEFDLLVNTPLITTGNVTLNSPVITNIPSTAGLVAPYFTVAGNSLPVPARISSVDSATQVTLNMVSTGTASDTPLTFSQDTYAVPTDLDWLQNQTMWDRTNRWALLGPDSPQTSQWLQSGIVPITPRRHFRQFGPGGNNFRIWPPPSEIATPLQLVFEYVSLNAVQIGGVGGSTLSGGSFSSDFGSDFNIGTAVVPAQYAQYFTSDSDTPLLDDQAIIMGLKWQFWRIKGFNFQDMKNEWVDYVQRLIGRDGSAPTLRLINRPTSILISPANIQDGNYPGG